MTAVVVNEIRRDCYLDSVALMRYSRAIAEMDGVIEAALMMGTPSNKQIMNDAQLLDQNSDSAGGGDLIIGVRAESDALAQAALGEARALLDKPSRADHQGSVWRPRTIRSALRAQPLSNLALISVPGWFAAAEARKAIRLGLDAMIFSDNVDIDEESALKQEARDLGRLVMGPDCGTAIINGVALAFANQVPRGEIGIIGASGTGIQEISCLIARNGGGISQAIGVGGRDLDEQVGGITTLMALDILTHDPNTRHIVLVSKPPSASVASSVLERLAASDKEFTVCFLGAGALSLPPNAHCAPTLKRAAESALGIDGFPVPARTSEGHSALPQGRRRVRGLYSGGSLCAEAQIVFLAAGETVASNAPVADALNVETGTGAHHMLDLGDDQFTRGRPHPMIDPSVRDEPIVDALHDPGVGVVLVDVVIGHGAHSDPAGHLAALVASQRPGDLPLVIASVIGTDDDPQGRAAQIRTLEDSGILVAPSNADAAAAALARVGRGN